MDGAEVSVGVEVIGSLMVVRTPWSILGIRCEIDMDDGHGRGRLYLLNDRKAIVLVAEVVRSRSQKTPEFLQIRLPPLEHNRATVI